MSERRAATTIGELDIHLSNVQASVERLTTAMGNMATKDDVRQLSDRMQTFATKAELAEVARRLEEDSAPSTFWRIVGGFTKIGAAVVVAVTMFGLVTAVTRFADKISVERK